jgi:hypothetical protein
LASAVAKARKKEIETGRFEPVRRRVGAYEFNRGAPGGSRSAARASIGAETSMPSTWASALGERDRARAGTAADIDNTR